MKNAAEIKLSLKKSQDSLLGLEENLESIKHDLQGLLMVMRRLKAQSDILQKAFEPPPPHADSHSDNND